ncbi:histidine phosphatase family protein [Methylobacterium iners]|uniref:Adenosylcobalamin/alpha-ribazole phosphatase n=1 Tax=Methylobacterium iners TaxID=418707 RepID=A0ABQ4RTS5_9HYPH|nr:histidine phosphatase family protein [Methylobacterium iners]GJD93568.1 Adenosylcobalamin/alpha-ribazole phosphatase [Methylobacterium iners]
MSRVYLVRHASHDRVHSVLCGRMPGVELSEEGRQEARALARRLLGCGAEAVVSSPRERARETASLVAEELGLPFELAPDLDDIDFGDWTGRSFVDLAEDPLWATWNAARSTVRPPGGESMDEAGARALGLLRELAGTSVVVSHCDVIRAVLLQILGLPIDSYDRIAVDPASLSILDLWPGGGRVAGLNERPGAG